MYKIPFSIQLQGVSQMITRRSVERPSTNVDQRYCADLNTPTWLCINWTYINVNMPPKSTQNKTHKHTSNLPRIVRRCKISAQPGRRIGRGGSKRMRSHNCLVPGNPGCSPLGASGAVSRPRGLSCSWIGSIWQCVSKEIGAQREKDVLWTSWWRATVNYIWSWKSSELLEYDSEKVIRGKRNATREK